jgi:ABC-type sugar transport system ATPase subunit
MYHAIFTGLSAPQTRPPATAESSEILLNVRAGDAAIVARVDPSTRVAVHEKVRLALDPARVHFFHASTEAAI